MINYIYTHSNTFKFLLFVSYLLFDFSYLILFLFESTVGVNLFEHGWSPFVFYISSKCFP